MANVKFFQGQESNLNNLSKKAGQVLLALNNNEGSLYYDIDSNTRIKLNAKNADTANRLTNSRTILTNLGSTSSASFNGTANITPGITGTLSISHGGTGATTAADARANLGVAASNHSHGVVTTSANGLMSAADKSKLDGIAANANKYTHPSYTAKSSGLYKITVDSLGHISTTTAVTKSDITALGIPGQDTNTTYSAFKGATSSAVGGAGLVPAPAAGASNRYLRSDGTWQVPPNTTYGVATTSTNGLMSASDKSKLDSIASGANKYTHPSYTARNSGLYKITVDSSGHISAVTAVTKSDITALGIPGQDTNTVYTHPTSSGNKHIPAGGSSGQILRWSANGTAVWGNDNNTTYSNFRGANTSAAGGSGLVPAPAQGSANRYLRSDGTWQVPPDTNTVYTHPTSSGYKHIPSGGASGQILKWSSSGTAVWGFSSASDITSGTLPIARGGTGATSASGARINLGAAAAEHTHSFFNDIIGTVPINRGGTGATTTADACANLGAVTLTTSQTILGEKTFRAITTIQNSATRPRLSFQSNNITTLTAETATIINNLVSTTGTNNYLYFRLYGRRTGGGVTSYYEDYRLPTSTANRTSNVTYEILTSKVKVAVAQGGTGTGVRGAQSGGALANIGCIYSTSEPMTVYEGMIWLKPVT